MQHWVKRTEDRLEFKAANYMDFGDFSGLVSKVDSCLICYQRKDSSSESALASGFPLPVCDFDFSSVRVSNDRLFSKGMVEGDMHNCRTTVLQSQWCWLWLDHGQGSVIKQASLYAGVPSSNPKPLLRWYGNVAWRDIFSFWFLNKSVEKAYTIQIVKTNDNPVSYSKSLTFR